MTVKSQILDGQGTGHSLRINGEGEAHVVVHDHPPRGEADTTIPFRQFFTDDGTATGSNDMRVDGSVTPVNFSINAIPGFDLYLSSISVVIADAGAELNEFGNLAALTNGVALCWETQDIGALVIADELKTNFTFVRLADGQPSFGSGNSAFKANNVIGLSEAYFMSIDLTRMSSQWGIRLRADTNDRLFFTINDDVTGVDQFDAIIYGRKF